MELIILCSLWVLTSTLVAFLPMERQYIPGLSLLFAAPVLIYAVYVQFGPLPFFAALLAFLSMFRNPLVFLVRRAMGKKVDLP